MFWKTIKAIFVNYFLLIPLTLGATFVLEGDVMFEMGLDSLPSSREMFRQIAFCYLIEDTAF